MRHDFDLEPLAHTTGPAGEVATWAVHVPPDLLYFEGHFPGAPMLPGVAQLVALVLARVQAVWPALGEPTRVSRLKFKRPIGPGDALQLTLELSLAAAPRVSFALGRGDEPVTSGTMTFATAAAEPAGAPPGPKP